MQMKHIITFSALDYAFKHGIKKKSVLFVVNCTYKMT